MTAPTRRLPDNAGIASEDTRGIPLSLCPQRPICCSAFRPALSSAGLSVDALAALLPLQWFKLCYAFYTPNVSVCQALFSTSGGFYSAAEGVKSENEQLEFAEVSVRPEQHCHSEPVRTLVWESSSNSRQPIVIQAVLLRRFQEFIHEKWCVYPGDCHARKENWLAMTGNSIPHPSVRQIPICLFAAPNQ